LKFLDADGSRELIDLMEPSLMAPQIVDAVVLYRCSCSGQTPPYAPLASGVKTTKQSNSHVYLGPTRPHRTKSSTLDELRRVLGLALEQPGRRALPAHQILQGDRPHDRPIPVEELFDVI
jgi:hypothetical protein